MPKSTTSRPPAPRKPAIAISRGIITVMENHQQADGSIAFFDMLSRSH